MHLEIYKESKYKILTLTLLFFVGVLEMFGLSLVYPFIAILFEINLGGEELIERITSLLTYFKLPISQYYLCLYIALVLLAKALLVTSYNYVINLSNIAYMINIRERIYLASFKTEFGYVSDKISRLINGLTIMSQSAGGAMNLQFRILLNFIILFFLLILGFLISWKMLLVALSIGAGIFLLLKFTITLSKVLGERIATLNEGLFRDLNQGLSNYRYLKSTSTYGHFYDDLKPTLADIFKVQLRFVLIKHGTNALTEPLMVVSLSVIIFLSLYLLGISMAAIIVMYIVLGRFYSQLILLTNNIQEYQREHVAAVYCNDLIKEMQQSYEIPGKTSYRGNLNKTLSVKNITFGFENKLFFENAEMDIDKNKITLISGPSGSGKSTLLNIILGLLNPKEGQVLIDDKEIKEFDRDDLRKQIGLVTQENSLFDMTLRENLSLRNPGVLDSELIGFIKKFRLESIFDGEINLDYRINESSSNLSGGEKQRICLIRELVAKPSILILDEFTSSLDKETLEIVISSISELKGSITIIIVSHQLEYLDLADKVYFVENNSLVEKKD